MLGFWSNQAWTNVVAHGLSPYQTNPLNINPLRDAIDALIDFDRVRACTDVEIFISATNVWSGEVAIFKTQELTADHLMASACLPTVFQAVEIDGVPYWDGGYMGNPALFPLIYESVTDDILLVQINPLERRQTPRTAREIHDRLNEITFNGNLLRELRAVAFVKRLIEEGKLSPDEYKNVHLHRIDGAGVLDDHEASSKRKAEWDFFVQLRDAGRRHRSMLARGPLRRDRCARHTRSGERSAVTRVDRGSARQTTTSSPWICVVVAAARSRQPVRMAGRVPHFHVGEDSTSYCLSQQGIPSPNRTEGGP